ncbi:hypothetical protein Ddye_020627 [Dipteronia dyeriana]|uniref:Transposase n=1 Tax=Dipteronia dyeriana TaxID=168575 RepID=A0AAD9U0P2_9ROSI|nr:hypothetical protein Ddye_020627 [Dipteronia dyeriana]
MRPNYELYDGVSDFKEVKLEVGQIFASSKVFKEAIKEYAIRCGRVIWFPCNEMEGERAKLKACEIIEGSLSTQYAKLWDYAKKLKKTNLESTIVIDTELGLGDKNKFRRIHIFFNACKQGWLHGCKKIIGLDACHVKAYHKAQLMWVGNDADNGYYPIAHDAIEK